MPAKQKRGFMWSNKKPAGANYNLYSHTATYMEQHHSQLHLTVQKLEWMFLYNTNAVMQAHAQAQFEMIFVTSGTGTHVVNGEKYRIKSGNIYAALPGQKHQLIPDAGIRGFMLCLDARSTHKTNNYNISNESVLHCFFSRHCQLSIQPEQIEGMAEAFGRLENELSGCCSYKTEIATTYLQILLLYIRREIERTMRSETTAEMNPLLKKFLLLVENNFKEKKSIADYAAELFVTPNYLHHVIKKTSGYSPGYHIRQRIIKEAKRKFMHSGASLKEISYDLGFYNTAHFSKLFKNTTGMNFTQFKKANYNSVIV